MNLTEYCQPFGFPLSSLLSGERGIKPVRRGRCVLSYAPDGDGLNEGTELFGNRSIDAHFGERAK